MYTINIANSPLINITTGCLHANADPPQQQHPPRTIINIVHPINALGELNENIL